MAPATAAKTTKKVKKTGPGAPVNSEMKKTGVMRLSKGRMFHKRGLWHIAKWQKTNAKTAAQKAPKKATKVVKKEVKGEKNGKTRTTRVNRFPKSYPTEDKPRKLSVNKHAARTHKHSLRSTITPGTVLILVAGRHAGKRVVFLKQLASGLILVTGPFKLNGCPMRRINAKYVIATSTKLDLTKLVMPENVNDQFFNRVKEAKAKSTDAEIFDVKKEQYKVNDARKAAQVSVDKQLMTAIKASKEKTLLVSWLRTKFALTNRQYPHLMKF
jgi:large subunit ribosomal protein L6e